MLIIDLFVNPLIEWFFRILSAVCLSPEFRLLQTCERRQNDNNLDEIDALLGRYFKHNKVIMMLLVSFKRC